jgi:glycosyltransferase involved in cell wall biosynthesis
MNERIDHSTLHAARAQPMLIDSSLSILNRTGAYHIAKDLVAALVPGQAAVRYWRLGSFAPEGIARKIAARLMMLEINWLGANERLQIHDAIQGHGFRLFLDPLYVLRSRLEPNDIVLCHDVGPLTHSELYDSRTSENYELAYEKILLAKPGIVFVSDFSLRQHTLLFGSDFRFLKTIPLYLRTELLDGLAEPVPGLRGRFFLTVGAIERRKNQASSLKAYRDGEFHRQGIDYVLCGPRGDGYAEIAKLAESIPGARLMGYVPDAQLRWLYGNAEAFLLPSLLEGFGMPALEAAYMGLLPIVSENSALVEAVGGQCLRVRPDRTDQIVEAMCEAISRSPAEKAEASCLLRATASAATKERYLQQWRELLMSQVQIAA